MGLREDQQIGHALAVEIANWLWPDESRFPRGPTAQPSPKRTDSRRARWWSWPTPSSTPTAEVVRTIDRISVGNFRLIECLMTQVGRPRTPPTMVRPFQLLPPDAKHASMEFCHLDPIVRGILTR